MTGFESPQNDPAVLVRFLKIVYAAMAGSVVLYLIVLEVVASELEPQPVGELRTALIVLAAILATVVLFLRFSILAGLLLPGGPAVPEARAAKLRTCYIICFTLAETVGLLGFVLRFVGGSRADAIPFFLGSFILFAACFPWVPDDLAG
ncbi:MAG: hypothetical protein LAO07_11555 [Acidobacteriia bacterium]|nr:hypothetical protein [Terriglobia bacterium]